MTAFGDTKETPFFQNFYAGGPRSLRGFESNTLDQEALKPHVIEFNYSEGTCPNLIDSDGDGILDIHTITPMQILNTISEFQSEEILKLKVVSN